MQTGQARESVTHVAFNPVGSLLASACDDATIGVWKVQKEPVWLQKIPGQENYVSSVAFNADGSVLAAGGGTG